MTNPMEINGGACVAMVGKNCVAIACDMRLGAQAMTISTDFPKVFGMTPRIQIGLTGLATDVLTVYPAPRTPAPASPLPAGS